MTTLTTTLKALAAGLKALKLADSKAEMDPNPTASD
jgi:hypothetical protein